MANVDARPGPLRLVVGYAAIAAAIPYFVLKLIWLTGGTSGFTPTTPTDAGFDALNAATFVMDAVAIAVALALTHNFGMRLPPPLVLFPMWVGTGFLAMIALAVPLSMLAALARGESLFPAVESIVQPWVYQMVYAGFICQGIALMTALLLYARKRWATLPSVQPSKLHSLLATVSAILAFFISAWYLFWAAGGTIGVPAQTIATSAFYAHLMDAVFGVLSLAGGVGILMLVRRPTSWLALTLAWVGGATNFSWGLWFTINVLMSSPLAQGAQELGALGLMNFLRVLAGMMIGLVAAYQLASDRVKA